MRCYGGRAMNLNEIKELVKLIDGSGLSEFNLEKCDIKIYMKKENGVRVVRNEKPVEVYEEEIAVEERRQVELKQEEKKQDANLHSVKSPMVGVFYGSPSPDAEPYAKPGSRVKKGDVLCIIEAMKLMNEITSDVDGEIVEVLGENQSPVEYGQPLFLIKRV
jgi:acetyl-CoA carboxylase biotin carboxyl carrier protein